MRENICVFDNQTQFHSKPHTMKLILLIFAAVVISLNESQASETNSLMCTPGEIFQHECNTCECNTEGQAMCTGLFW